MATKKRLIDANDALEQLKQAEKEMKIVTPLGCKAVDIKAVQKYIESRPTVDAVVVDEIKPHHVIIDNEGVPEVKLQIGDRYFLLRTDSVDVREVVHSRFVNVVDFGDDQGCFGYCERCGTIHHAQHPVALKADHRWCIWCGAKMDGDGNGT